MTLLVPRIRSDPVILNQGTPECSAILNFCSAYHQFNTVSPGKLAIASC